MSTTTTLTPLQRLMADEPVFFKIIKFICVILLAGAALMEKFHIGSPFIIDALTVGGTVGFGVASFVVKEANLLITQGITATTALQVIDDTTNEIAEVKAEIKASKNVPLMENPPPPPPATASAPSSDLSSAIKDAQTLLNNNPAT